MTRVTLSLANRLAATLAVCLLLSGGTVRADASEVFRLSGFLTLAGGFGSDDYPYNFNIKRPGETYSGEVDPSLDTRLGVQLDVALGARWSAMLQLVSRGLEGFEPDLTWAVLAFQATDRLKLRVGRLRSPLYLYSDSSDVGYAYPWISLPREAYFVDTERLDAIDILYSFTTGGVGHQVEAYYGRSRDDSFGPDGSRIDISVDDACGLIWSPNWRWLTLRFAYHRGTVDYLSREVRRLAEAIAMTVPLGTPRSTANRFDPLGLQTTYLAVGIRLDLDPVYLIAEHNQLLIDHFVIPQRRRWHLTLGGYLAPDLQIYGLFETSTDADDQPFATRLASIPDATCGGAPGCGDAIRATLIGGIESLPRQRRVDSLSLGARWDVRDGLALKLQYTHVEDQVLDKSANLLRLSVDALF